jgi:hypothetical protein
MKKEKRKKEWEKRCRKDFKKKHLPMNNGRFSCMQIMQPQQNLPTPIPQNLRLDRPLILPQIALQSPTRHKLRNKTDTIPPISAFTAPGVVHVDNMVVAQTLKDLDFWEDAARVFFCEVVDAELVPGDFYAFFFVVGFKDFFVCAFTETFGVAGEAVCGIRLCLFFFYI